ncbi:MAG TPA: hypothetical protein VG013_18480 [Gemmataceae bacterium]|nr:hypothetical protein [Gemmataceae bacterium]
MVTLQVRDKYGALAAVRFRVDTAADLTSVPIKKALRERIPFGQGNPGVTRGLAGGVARFRDEIRIVIAGREHIWPCDFLEDPAAGEAEPAPRELTPVLGRAGLLDEYAFCIDSGFLILTRLGWVRRFWRRCLHRSWGLFGLIQPADRPLDS